MSADKFFGHFKAFQTQNWSVDHYTEQLWHLSNSEQDFKKGWWSVNLVALHMILLLLLNEMTMISFTEITWLLLQSAQMHSLRPKF